MKTKKTAKSKKSKTPFESARKSPDQWLDKELPLLCDAVRMQPETDPWEKKGKILRADSTTENKRKRLQEISHNVEHFVSDESGAFVA